MLCFVALLLCFSRFIVALHAQILYTNFGTQTWQCKFSAQILRANLTHENHLFVVFKFCLACAKCFEIKLVFVRSADTLQDLGDLLLIHSRVASRICRNGIVISNEQDFGTF